MSSVSWSNGTDCLVILVHFCQCCIVVLCYQGKREMLHFAVVHYLLFYRNLAKTPQNLRAVPPLMSHPCDRHRLLWTQLLQSTQALKRLWSYPLQNMYCTPTLNLSKSANNTLSCQRKAKSATAKCQRSSDAGSSETPWLVWLQSWGQKGMENHTDTHQNQKLQQWQRE